jgi:hypothetical protein
LIYGYNLRTLQIHPSVGERSATAGVRPGFCRFFTPHPIGFYAPFMRRRSIIAISDMNTAYLRTRQISLALLVTAVVEHHQTPGSADVCNPNASRLWRLGHELIHNASGKRLPRPR